MRFTGTGKTSYGDPFPPGDVQPVQALPGVREIIPLDNDLLFLEPSQRIPHRPRRQRSLPYEILLREAVSVFQYLVYELGRWRQVPDSLIALFAGVYNKNDPS